MLLPTLFGPCWIFGLLRLSYSRMCAERVTTLGARLYALASMSHISRGGPAFRHQSGTRIGMSSVSRFVQVGLKCVYLLTQVRGVLPVGGNTRS